MTYDIRISRAFASPDPRFSKQVGWGDTVTVGDTPGYIVNAEATLGLAHQGGHQHKLDAACQMQAVAVKEWYDWHNDDSNFPAGEAPADIAYNALTWNSASGAFVDAGAAAAWVAAEHAAGRHHTYIIGNEPDGPYTAGGTDMTGAQVALMHHTAADLIRANCSDAFIISAGWLNGIARWSWVGEPTRFAYDPTENNEEGFLLAHLNADYNPTHLPLDADALSWHSYQNTTPELEYPALKFNTFAAKVREWKAKGWTSTDKIILTEFGWDQGYIESSTAENCAAFMTWLIPQLKANPQVLRWHWWHIQGGDYMTGGGGTTITDLGAHYKEMATNS